MIVTVCDVRFCGLDWRCDANLNKCHVQALKAKLNSSPLCFRPATLHPLILCLCSKKKPLTRSLSREAERRVTLGVASLGEGKAGSMP